MEPRKNMLWYLIVAAHFGSLLSTQFVQWPLYTQNIYGDAIQAYWIGETRSMLSCYVMCNQVGQCHTAAFSKMDLTCYLYDTSPNDYDVNSLRVLMPSKLHFKKVGNVETDDSQCSNGAIKHNETHCECIGGYVGQFCDQFMQDCSEGFDSGFYDGIDGVFVIKPTLAFVPFQVRCIMERGGFTVIQSNTIQDIINFNRTWPEYVEGFGMLSGSHWLGLDKMYNITFSRVQNAHIYVKTLSSPNYFVRLYLGFTVDTDFKMNYDFSSSANGYDDLGDSLLPSRTQLFTTYDVDNDKSTASNCAVRFGAGFWFNDCGNCNPNGIIDGVSTPSDTKHAHWSTLGSEIITDIEIRLVRYL